MALRLLIIIVGNVCGFWTYRPDAPDWLTTYLPEKFYRSRADRLYIDEVYDMAAEQS